MYKRAFKEHLLQQMRGGRKCSLRLKRVTNEKEKERERERKREREGGVEKTLFLKSQGSIFI